MKLILIASILFFFNAAYAKDKTTNIFLTERNTVSLSTEMNLSSIDTLINAMVMKRISLPAESMLYLLIVSIGGEVRTIDPVLKMASELPNIAVICKYCASAAGSLFVRFPGPKYVIKKSVAMFHHDALVRFTADMVDNVKMLQTFKQESKEFDQQIADAMGMELKDYEVKIKEKDWDISGFDIIKIDRYVTSANITCDADALAMYPDTCSQ